ncbi:hypothetical protein F4781DRAFT_392448 [Annulohypoxylon bovei var. microspora]|nr:hypothetical protein F4781DRAFT_392448 [Annulohypoxylon bovei var. microspora]
MNWSDQFVPRRPKGLRKLIIAGGPARACPCTRRATSISFLSCHRMCGALSRNASAKVTTKAKSSRRPVPYFTPATSANSTRFQVGFEHLKEDPTAGLFRQGPSEFTIVGSFKDWEPWKEAHNIEVEALLINGDQDEAMDLCIEPWFRSIAKVKWVTLSNASHMTHWEHRERFNELCGTFLLSG